MIGGKIRKRADIPEGQETEPDNVSVKVNDAYFYKRGHDNRNNADYRRAPANVKLWRILCFDLLYFVGPRSERLRPQTEFRRLTRRAAENRTDS